MIISPPVSDRFHSFPLFLAATTIREPTGGGFGRPIPAYSRVIPLIRLKSEGDSTMIEPNPTKSHQIAPLKWFEADLGPINARPRIAKRSSRLGKLNRGGPGRPIPAYSRLFPHKKCAGKRPSRPSFPWFASVRNPARPVFRLFQGTLQGTTNRGAIILFWGSVAGLGRPIQPNRTKSHQIAPNRTKSHL
jgi:hypothetical protein